MSILRNVIDEQGDEIIGAYSKITTQSSNNAKDKTNFVYQVETWKSQVAYEASKPSIQSLNDRFEVMITDMVSVDIAGLYTHLMTHERYINGVVV